jgi:hypothetical protein
MISIVNLRLNGWDQKRKLRDTITAPNSVKRTKLKISYDLVWQYGGDY